MGAPQPAPPNLASILAAVRSEEIRRDKTFLLISSLLPKNS